MEWGQYVEAQMYEATLDGEDRERYYKINGIRARVLRRLLGEEEASSAELSTTAKIEDVPNRVRPPQADDPDDPFGLWDKSDPAPPPRGQYKDPQELWDRLNGKK
jgi:hypothetical protein